MFLLRGRSQEEVVAALRARRAGPEPAAETPADDVPVEADARAFWTAPPQSDEVALHFALPETDALATKRLGPMPSVRDQAALSAALERMYQRIGEYALLLALGDTEGSGPT
jgi:hypothetical protein